MAGANRLQLVRTTQARQKSLVGGLVSGLKDCEALLASFLNMSVILDKAFESICVTVIVEMESVTRVKS